MLLAFISTLNWNQEVVEAFEMARSSVTNGSQGPDASPAWFFILGSQAPSAAHFQLGLLFANAAQMAGLPLY